ncbi:membrane dipeptidase [Maribellus comscasis]|uniref:Membrane dipeptidase n=1 Tax=Maribellus comscasis TaxID=2681766 RepID=A0A6I6JWJ0_9BACT|nr:dipeptidase [Maribellus comscasis]QGY44477.1 membrane dipeptidase [Maribellus comscasis]
MLKKSALFTSLFLFLISTTATSQENMEKTKTIHEKALTVDTHCDTPMALLGEDFDVGRKNKAPQSRVDFPRMKDGGLDAIFFAAFTSQRERTSENTEAAYKRAHEMIDSTYSVCKRYNSLAEVAINSNDAKRIEGTGKRAIYIGMENGFPIGTDIKRVKEFYDRGVRYITLSHSSNNDICDSSTDKEGPEHNGLSQFGEKVVREMNKLGMMIDVSHISDKAFFDVIEQSKVPVIASHSSVRSIAHHPRNMTDNMIKALAKNGGVIQICLLDDYIKDPDTTTIRYQKAKEIRKIFNTTYNTMNKTEQDEVRKQWRELGEKYPKKLPTVADCVDHIDYVKNLVGIDYVGIGSDFDGGGGLADCQDVSQMPNITAEMIKRGYTEGEIQKVWGGNFFRVFAEVEKHAN